MTPPIAPAEFDFEHAVSVPFRMQPGLRRMSPGAPQLHPNLPGARHLREKIAVLLNWSAQTLLCEADFDPTPAWQALADHAVEEQAQAFEQRPDGVWWARLLGCGVSPDGQVLEQPGAWTATAHCLLRLPPAWRRAALLALVFEEDFAVVDGARASLPCLLVALPSHWAPEDKLGRTFADAHGPVAEGDTLRQAGDHLMRLVCGPQRWERFVWTLTRHPRLHSHPARLDPAPWPSGWDAAELAANTWWRTERQTFIPLPHATQAVFTIRIQSQRLTEVGLSATQALRLHDSLASMSPAVLAYRSLGPARDRLLQWLAAQARGVADVALDPFAGP